MVEIDAMDFRKCQ